MKILYLHLSDLHIEKREDGYNMNVDKITKALNTFGQFECCVIVISGDITKHGFEKEFAYAGGFLGALIKTIKLTSNGNVRIEVVVVPGNHDLDLSNNARGIVDIEVAYKSNKINEVVNTDLKSLHNFYKFANRNGCFTDNRLISKKIINLEHRKIAITLINTAPLSVVGGSNLDMGLHYFDEVELSELIPIDDSMINICVMHHSTEWYCNPVKEKMRKIIHERFSIVFEGHEHEGYGDVRKLNNGNQTFYVQGNSLSGDKNHTRGFVAIIYDDISETVVGHTFTWNIDYYKSKLILDEKMNLKKFKGFTIKKEFKEKVRNDDSNRDISAYFVFPSLTYNMNNQIQEIEDKNVTDIDSFIRFVLDNNKTIITGDNKSGKSTLAKFLYTEITRLQNDIVPILLVSEEIKHIKIDKIIKYGFEDQYEEEGNSYDKFLQLSNKSRILIIDDAGKIEKNNFEKILNYLSDYFENIVLFSDQKIDMNIENQVIDALTEKKVGHVYIKPFLYDKRKILISNICNLIGIQKSIDEHNRFVDELNNLISSQVRYFRLDPDFIVNFVYQYLNQNKITITPGSNVFNMVYENSIKNKIISASSNDNVSAIFRVFSEVAFYMHFSKLTWIDISMLQSVINTYNIEFGQNVKIINFIDIGKRSKLIIESESQFRFKDNNLLAYFVAQALNNKYHFDDEIEDIKEKTEHILNNICFGINSDIILFMALITNNPKIINIILSCANSHFENMDELMFDKNNIPFLCNSSLGVKDSFPTLQEKEEKIRHIVKYEEELKASELVELINEYDYDESDLQLYENQIMKSFKYIEIINKILPSFGQNMKVPQQARLVEAIYSAPNKFIFLCLNEISEGYEEFILYLYDKISEIRKEKNISEISLESVENMIGQMGLSMVANVYNYVASVSATKHTMQALERFNYSENTNYMIMNLMMTEKGGNLHSYYEKAVSLNNKSKQKNTNSFVKYSVRNYFLNNSVKLVGDGQSLFDHFFGKVENDGSEKKKIKLDNVRKNINQNKFNVPFQIVQKNSKR